MKCDTCKKNTESGCGFFVGGECVNYETSKKQRVKTDKPTIAQKIEEITGYAESIVEANHLAVKIVNDYFNGLTVASFEDGSKLLFDDDAFEKHLIH